MMAALAHDLSENARPLPPYYISKLSMPSVQACQRNRRSGEKAEITLAFSTTTEDAKGKS